MASTSTDPATRPEEASGSTSVPQYYLGMRRTWWVVFSLLLLVAVDAVPVIGPYLALGALLWMVAGLARAQPRPSAPQPERRRAAVRADPTSALPSS